MARVPAAAGRTGGAEFPLVLTVLYHTVTVRFVSTISQPPSSMLSATGAAGMAVTKIKATFEKVEEAVRTLNGFGERPTISKVMALVGGGSRSTILAHMQTLFDRVANDRSPSNVSKIYLQSAAEPMVTKLWADARRAASLELEHRMHALVDLHEGMAEELRGAMAAEDAAKARAEAAESRLAEVEAELRARQELETHLSDLSKVVRQLRGGAPDESARMQLLKLVAELDFAPTRDEVYRRMTALGYPDATAYTARYYVVEQRYCEERGEAQQLYLTDLGRSRLASAIAEAGQP